MNRRIKRAAAMGQRIVKAEAGKQSAWFKRLDDFMAERSKSMGYSIIQVTEDKPWGYTNGLRQSHGFEVYVPELPNVFSRFVNATIDRLKDIHTTFDHHALAAGTDVRFEDLKTFVIKVKAHGMELPIQITYLRAQHRGQVMSKMNVVNRNSTRKERQGMKIFQIQPA